MAIEVRPGVLGDLEWLSDQYDAYSKFYTGRLPLFSDPSYRCSKVTEYIEKHLVLVAQRGICRLGFMIGLVASHPFNAEIRVLVSILWWVMPEHRRTRAGATLLWDFISWGRENCDAIVMGIQHNTPVREASLLRRGFRLQERSYMMEVGKWAIR